MVGCFFCCLNCDLGGNRDLGGFRRLSVIAGEPVLGFLMIGGTGRWERGAVLVVV